MSTNEPMTQERLDEIQEREAKATEGPWGVDGPAQCGPGDSLAVYHVEDGGTVAYVQPSWDDAEFIAHAREDIPALLAEVERLSRRNEDLEYVAAQARKAVERLRALTTVDEDMVERAARSMSAHWHDWHTNEALGRQRALAQVALEAALGTGGVA